MKGVHHLKNVPRDHLLNSGCTLKNVCVFDSCREKNSLKRPKTNKDIPGKETSQGQETPGIETSQGQETPRIKTPQKKKLVKDNKVPGSNTFLSNQAADGGQCTSVSVVP